MQIDAIDEALLEQVTGGIDWNQVGMQALYGGAAGAGIGAAFGGVGGPVGAAGGAAVGAGLGIWSTWNQRTVR
jgi:hypothetical protein